MSSSYVFLVSVDGCAVPVWVAKNKEKIAVKWNLRCISYSGTFLFLREKYIYCPYGPFYISIIRRINVFNFFMSISR